MRTINIEDKPIALVIQIDPNNLNMVEAILKCEYAIAGHTGVRDIWWKEINKETRTAIEEIISIAHKELLENE